MNQLDLHKAIDEAISKGVGLSKTNKISDLINANLDAKQYFFSKADENWLEWLWLNGFMEDIKRKASDPNSYGYRMPELHFLDRVAEKKPNLVTEIICAVDISPQNFNPEIVDRFTRIASKLPSGSLKRIVRKIKNEEWVRLMGSYTQYGFEYADMLETLQKAADFGSILILSEAIFLIRKKEDIKQRKIAYKGDDIFYIHDLSETKVFMSLIEMPEKYLEKAISIVLRAFIDAIEDSSNYLLSDEDFFTLSLKTVEGDHYGSDLKFIAATIIELTRKLFSYSNLDNKEIYAKYFTNLPINPITRRLKLFVFSLDPKSFIEDLKIEYFKLFEAKKILDILYGAEYERALKAGFNYLNVLDKRKYIAKVFSLFTNVKSEDDKRWKRHYASCILSTISVHLTNEEVALAQQNEFKIDAKYDPEPSIGKIRSGTVISRSPISFTSLSINDIAEKLKGELSPNDLQKRYKNDDFSNPRDANGVSEQLKSDIKNRIADYVNNAPLFFDRDKLSPHYTNAYLRGVKDALAESRNTLENLEYLGLINLLLAIKESGQKNMFGKVDIDSENRWLTGWNSVHATISDLIEELIRQKDTITLLNFKKYRESVLSVLSYLFTYNDPIPEDEKIKTAKSTIKNPSESDYSISDPYTIAINSVRGQAFQALLHFVYQDSSNNEKIKLAEDVKVLYSKLLDKENTRAIMFMFGHYLPTFHFRDMEWTRRTFKTIFESKKKDKYLRLAAWEGYLSNNLYNELFFEEYFQKLYSKNITLKLTYPKQKFFKDPQESLSIHLALALIHYEEFDLNNNLLRKFLQKANDKQLSAFISFIGGSYLSGDNNAVIKDKNFPWRINRIMDFWKMMLKTKYDSPALSEFGKWVETSNDVFEVKWLADILNQTLKVTKGKLIWNYGLLKSIEELANKVPEITVEILEKYFLTSVIDAKDFFLIREDKEWYNAFKILYECDNKKIKDKTYILINILIEKYGNPFWSLEDIVKSKA